MRLSRRYRSILIADPDTKTLVPMVQCLRAAGYQATGVVSFEEARRQLQIDAPDLLITEARLGRHHGLHLVLIAENRDMKKLVMSARADQALERDATKFGAALVVKPIDPSALLRIVVAIIGGSPDMATGEPILLGPDRRHGERREVMTPDFFPERRMADRRRPS